MELDATPIMSLDEIALSLIAGGAGEPAEGARALCPAPDKVYEMLCAAGCGTFVYTKGKWQPGDDATQAMLDWVQKQNAK
jgi:hypothetical protein